MSVASRRPLRIQWWASAALVMLFVLVLTAMTAQGLRSQELVEHRAWRDTLESVTATYLTQHALDPTAPLPQTGILRAWYLDAQRPVPDLPKGLATREPGYHTDGDTFHAIVTPLAQGRLISFVDISAIEAQQNRDAWLSVMFGIFLLVLIAALILWLHANLVRPVKDLAQRMQNLDPSILGQRLPTAYRQEEFQIIAMAANAHLARVDQFIEREKSLLDQASHEFRTPIAVISGAVDVLRLQALPPTALPVLARISDTIDYLSEIMTTLLALAREEHDAEDTYESTALHELIPELLQDHMHLLQNKRVALKASSLDPTYVHAPEAMLRIALGNIVRNAVEHTYEGQIEVSLHNGIVTVTDSGSGADMAEIASRYRESLRRPGPTRGQGLGLFLIRRICERFQWRIEVETSPAGGTRISVDFRGVRP